ncbi:MAG: hypothetical protein Q9191_000195 [Dirinaria sp. TL-2023a]
MDGIEEDDGYSDDDLDALQLHDFQELQQDAIRSTQQPRPPRQIQSPYATRGTNLKDRLGGLEQISVHGNGGAASFSHQPSSDYGDFDDEMLDGQIFDAGEEPTILPDTHHTLKPIGESTQREQWRQQRYGAVLPDTEHQKQSPFAIRREGPSRPEKHGTPGPTSSPLNQRTWSATKPIGKSEALSKIGEIAIVRANRVKEKQEEEKRLWTERKARTEEQTKHNAELQRYKSELQKVSTDKAFIENDLVREAEQRKGIQKSSKAVGKSKTVEKENAVTTPRKNKDLRYGDGFNDDEAQVPSPSKLPLRSKPATPKAGVKRKRKALDNSPVKPLQLGSTAKDQSTKPTKDKPDLPPSQNAQQQHDDEFAQPESSLKIQHDERFKITHQVLDHRIKPDEKRSFEALADFSLPSDSEKRLSGVLLDGLSPLNTAHKVDKFAATIALTAISLWSECLDAAMYRAVELLMDLVWFVLVIAPPGTAPHLTDELTVLAQRTADLNLIPRIRRKPPSKYTAAIGTKQCLEILHLMAYDCLAQKEDLERFWRCMRVDFIAMALKIDQPIEEIHVALDVLGTSVLDKTFAMIRSAADGDQENSEQGLIQIISSLFVETPRVPIGRKPYDPIEIAQLRLEALSLFEKMCQTEHGGEALAKCVNVFVRLIRFMNDEINSLYDYKPAHEYSIELINQSMRLLYHITTTYPDLINIQERLATTPGGAHKYLIVLTRLNFSDGIFYERGIEDDVVECAQHLLENWVTPEEGEALVEAFSSAKK